MLRCSPCPHCLGLLTLALTQERKLPLTYYAGCFGLEALDLINKVNFSRLDMESGLCIELCGSQDVDVYSVHGTDCICRNIWGVFCSAQDQLYGIRCPGNATELCGGSGRGLYEEYAISIYSKDKSLPFEACDSLSSFSDDLVALSVPKQREAMSI